MVRLLGVIALASLIACGVSVALAAHPNGIPDGTRITRLVVDKSDRTMEAYDDSGTLIRAYRVGIGRGGMGHKGWEGDAITPEGSYRIDERHRSKQFHRFLHISYPNREDRRRYARRRRAGEVPDRAGIGSAIGIHGTGGRDWVPRRFRSTLGCVMVDDDEAEELYGAVVDDAVIVIQE